MADIGGIAIGLRGYVEGTQRKEAIDRSNRTQDLRDEGLRLQLENLKKDAAYQEMARKHQTAVGTFLQSGGTDLEPMKEFFRSTPGSQFEDLTLADDGSYDFKVAGKVHKIKDADSLGAMSMMALDPKTYLKHKQDIEKSRQTNAGKNTITTEEGYLMERDEKGVYRYAKDEKGGKVKAQTFGGRRLGSGAGGNASAEVQLLQRLESHYGMSPDEALDFFTNYKNKSLNSSVAIAKLIQARKEALMKYAPIGSDIPSDEEIRDEVFTDLESAATTVGGIKRGKGKGGSAPDPMSGFINRDPQAAGTGVTAYQFGIPRDGSAPSGSATPVSSAEKPAQLPPKALQALKNAGGKPVKFNNGQVWRLGPDGQPVQVK